MYSNELQALINTLEYQFIHILLGEVNSSDTSVKLFRPYVIIARTIDTLDRNS